MAQQASSILGWPSTYGLQFYSDYEAAYAKLSNKVAVVSGDCWNCLL